MKGLGSGDNGEFTFLDLLAIVSFFVGVSNYDMNLTQDDKQDLQNNLSDKANLLLDEIHGHLKSQDEKIDMILKLLEESNANNKETGRPDS